jgi:hypothetical protein
MNDAKSTCSFLRWHSRLPFLTAILIIAPAFWLGCSDGPDDIFVRSLKITDNDSVEIEEPHAGQNAFVEIEWRCQGMKRWVRFLVTRDEEVIWDFDVMSYPSDDFGRMGGEFVMPDTGTYHYKVVADPENLIDEDNEDNNEATTTVTVIE